MKTVIILSAAALVLWMVMFSPWTAPYCNFWLLMTLSSCTLAVSALFLQRGDLAGNFRFKALYIIIGIFSAAVLYAVFTAGNFTASKLFPFGQRQINGIYGLKTQSNPITLGLILPFLIAPAEEIFWRGFIQQKLALHQGTLKGLLMAASIYGLVHLWAFNFMLFAAAIICGLFWGFIYMKYRSLWPGIISHALWDLFIFVLLPLPHGVGGL